MLMLIGLVTLEHQNNAFVTNEHSVRSGVSIFIFSLHMFVVIHTFYSEDTPYIEAQIQVMINSSYPN